MCVRSRVMEAVKRRKVLHSAVKLLELGLKGQRKHNYKRED